jgi:hypothetical protein
MTSAAPPIEYSFIFLQRDLAMLRWMRHSKIKRCVIRKANIITAGGSRGGIDRRYRAGCDTAGRYLAGYVSGSIASGRLQRGPAPDSLLCLFLLLGPPAGERSTPTDETDSRPPESPKAPSPLPPPLRNLALRARTPPLQDRLKIAPPSLPEYIPRPVASSPSKSLLAAVAAAFGRSCLRPLVLLGHPPTTPPFRASRPTSSQSPTLPCSRRPP